MLIYLKGMYYTCFLKDPFFLYKLKIWLVSVYRSYSGLFLYSESNRISVFFAVFNIPGEKIKSTFGVE